MEYALNFWSNAVAGLQERFDFNDEFFVFGIVFGIDHRFKEFLGGVVKVFEQVGLNAFELTLFGKGFNDVVLVDQEFGPGGVRDPAVQNVDGDSGLFEIGYGRRRIFAQCHTGLSFRRLRW